MAVPTSRDPTWIRAVLAGWLEEKLGGDVELEELPSPAFSGFSNETLLFTVRNGERVFEIAVRLAPTGHRVFPDAAFDTQVRVIEALRRSAVRVPTILWHEPGGDALATPFFVMERVNGRAPPDNPPYHVAGWLHEAAPEVRERVWWNGLDAMVAVHLTPPLEFLSPVTPGEQLTRDRSYLEWVLHGRSYPIVAGTLDDLEARVPAAGTPAQCWGDARIGNILYDETGEVLAVLDWEMVTVGDPLADLAWFLLLDRHHSESCGAPRLDGFPSHEETVARWERRTGRDAGNLGWWMTLGACRYAAILTRVMDLLEDTGLLPGARGMAFDNTSTKLLAAILEDRPGWARSLDPR